MGDDLTAARHFSTLCEDNLRILTSPDTLRSDYLSSLTTIHDQAIALNARAISRAARLALDEHHHDLSRPRHQGNVLVLNKLIHQYRTGLEEIGSRQSETLLTENMREAKVETSDPTLDRQARDEVEAHIDAHETLKPLIKFAETESDRTSLLKLMSLHVVPSPQQVLDADMIEWETIIQNITAESLRMAREYNKTVSISHAGDMDEIDADIAASLEPVINDICASLVLNSVEDADLRQSRGLSRSAHIAITSRNQGSKFDVLIVCEGRSHAHILWDNHVSEPIEKLGATLNKSYADGLARTEITGLPIHVKLNSIMGSTRLKNVNQQELTA